MKRRKHRKVAQTKKSSRAIERKATEAVLAYDIARYSAETVFYRVAMAQQAAAEPFGLEALTMVSEKLLAAGEATAIAVRHLGPIQRLWTRAWFEHLSALQQSWHSKEAAYDSARTFTTLTNYWFRASDLADVAVLSQMKPVHRAVKGNARRLANLRLH